MNTAQRVIKYCAVAFAILLVGGIISAIISGGMLMAHIFGGWYDTESIAGVTEVIEVGEVTPENLTGLYIDVKATSVVITRGEEFKLESDEGIIKVSRGNNALYIQEKDFNLLTDWGTRGRELKLTLPEDWDALETLRLNAGAGRVEVRDLQVRNLELDLGAGKTELHNVMATERAKVKGGAGYLAVHGSEMKNLDLDMGVGKVELGVKLSGSNQIDAGVGKLELNLRGDAEDYRVKVKKGLGSITLDDEKMADGASWGEGAALVDIDGGVGAIEIRTQQ